MVTSSYCGKSEVLKVIRSLWKRESENGLKIVLIKANFSDKWRFRKESKESKSLNLIKIPTEILQLKLGQVTAKVSHSDPI